MEIYTASINGLNKLYLDVFDEVILCIRYPPTNIDQKINICEILSASPNLIRMRKDGIMNWYTYAIQFYNEKRNSIEFDDKITELIK